MVELESNQVLVEFLCIENDSMMKTGLYPKITFGDCIAENVIFNMESLSKVIHEKKCNCPSHKRVLS